MNSNQIDYSKFKICCDDLSNHHVSFDYDPCFNGAGEFFPKVSFKRSRKINKILPLGSKPEAFQYFIQEIQRYINLTKITAKENTLQIQYYNSRFKKWMIIDNHELLGLRFYEK